MPDIYLKDKNGIPRKYEDISAVRFVGDPLGTEYVTYSESASLIALTVNPSRSSQHIEPPTGYTGFSEVNVNPVTNVTADNIKAGQTILDVTGTYTTSNNPITAGDVLSGKEGFVNGGSVIVGNMPNNGAGSWTLDDVADLPLSISPGYYSSGTITIDSTSLTNLAAGNIKKNVEILGVTGDYEGAGAGSPVTITPYVISQIVNPSDYGTPSFSQVTVDAVPYSEVANSTGTTAIIGSTPLVIQAGTYQSKTYPATYEYKTCDIPINFTYTVVGIQVSSSKMYVAYDDSLYAWGLYDSSSAPIAYNGDHVQSSYFWYVPLTSPVSPVEFHVTSDTVVTPYNKDVFDMYFQRTSS